MSKRIAKPARASKPNPHEHYSTFVFKISDDRLAEFSRRERAFSDALSISNSIRGAGPAFEAAVQDTQKLHKALVEHTQAVCRSPVSTATDVAVIAELARYWCDTLADFERCTFLNDVLNSLFKAATDFAAPPGAKRKAA